MAFPERFWPTRLGPSVRFKPTRVIIELMRVNYYKVGKVCANEKQLNPATALTKIDVNTIQEVLSREGQAQIKTMFVQLPQAMQGQLAVSLSHFLNVIKTALSYAIDHMFLVSTILMLVALITVFFLPQIPLRKKKSPGVM